eukprot:TRINITY_DN8893_c0_g1_i2.p2 TRINITY_DN8893_c0_g1~~TRINITY_DN8893_c0_g1_i2.p2  ORF type:complete len:103 (-),score=25.60 TRINITY_DN8893_c0_g1_i2:384-692(-)
MKLLQDKRFWEEHPRNCNNSQKQQHDLQGSLAPEQLIVTKIISGTQEHVNHHMIKISLGSRAPLDDYKECKISKEAVKKDDLRQKLVPYVQRAAKKLCIEVT